MIRTFLFVLLTGCFFPLIAQDAYHGSLDNLLRTTYALPAPAQWVLPNTEAATLASEVNYGGITTAFSITGQSFTQGRRRVVNAGTNPWDAGHYYKNIAAVAAGNKCLIVFWLRSLTPNAKVNIFAENAVTYDKETYTAVSVGSEWQLYAVPVEAKAAYNAGALSIGLHLAESTQTVEIGGAACINYQNSVFFSQLPVLLNSSGYDGQAANAPWRAQAAADIEQFRKADMIVRVQNNSGQPVSGVKIHVEMLQHEFKFGTAVVSNRFNGGSAFDATYEQKLLNLDGKGHGFNEVVFENDLKWPAWEQAWFSSKPAIASDVRWLKDRGISVRGHNLVWPSWQYSPNDINASVTPAYLKTRIRNHLKNILTYSGIGTETIDWDVLNEITANTEYAAKFAGTPGYVTGRELYVDIFRQADSLAPNSVLYLNDYVAIEQGDSPSNGIATWKNRLNELVAAGAPVEGIGFQGHFSTTPTGIPRVKAIYDDFWNSYGLEAKVTEYDIDRLVSPATQADYMRDILTITFAHPSMKGFLMWGFWDGAHWLNNAPIFRQDWILKPSGEAFIDQVFKKWWTDETFTTTTSGDLTLRGFRGKYKITATCPDGSTQMQEIVLDATKTVQMTANCVTGIRETPADVELKAFAEAKFLQVSWSPALLQEPSLRLRVLDSTGRLMAAVHPQTLSNSHAFDLSSWPDGVYLVLLENGLQRQTTRVVVMD